MDKRAQFQAEYADRILSHYIILAMKEAGCRVDGDTHAELDGIISSAIAAAVAPLGEKIIELEQRLEALEANSYTRSLVPSDGGSIFDRFMDPE